MRSRKPEVSRGSGARTEIYLTARWASALPIRQAYAIQDFGRGGLHSPEAIQRLSSEPTEYVLELAGFPTILFKKGSQELEDALTASAISIPGRPPVGPTSVVVPAHGLHLMATMRFPRFANVQPADGSITLTASAGTIYIEHGFRLKSMVYQVATGVVKTGGKGGIRTHGRVTPSAVFKTAALNRSATFPAI